MEHLKTLVARFAQDESGQDLIEYALIMGLVALGAITALSGLSTSIKSTFNAVHNTLTSAV